MAHRVLRRLRRTATDFSLAYSPTSLTPCSSLPHCLLTRAPTMWGIVLYGSARSTFTFSQPPSFSAALLREDIVSLVNSQPPIKGLQAIHMYICWRKRPTAVPPFPLSPELITCSQTTILPPGFRRLYNPAITPSGSGTPQSTRIQTISSNGVFCARVSWGLITPAFASSGTKDSSLASQFRTWYLSPKPACVARLLKAACMLSLGSAPYIALMPLTFEKRDT